MDRPQPPARSESVSLCSGPPARSDFPTESIRRCGPIWPDIAWQNGVGQPGEKRLEGPQTPQITIQKSAPPEVQVGRPAVFRVTVRNTGTIPAGNFRISDQVPRGTRLLATTPQASQGSRGELVWSLGSLGPGAEASVEMQLMPTAEGEIGSVATVHFDADATVRTVSTRPRLVVGDHRQRPGAVGRRDRGELRSFEPGHRRGDGRGVGGAVPEGLTHPTGGNWNIPSAICGPMRAASWNCGSGPRGQAGSPTSLRPGATPVSTPRTASISM